MNELLCIFYIINIIVGTQHNVQPPPQLFIYYFFLFIIIIIIFLPTNFTWDKISTNMW